MTYCVVVSTTLSILRRSFVGDDRVRVAMAAAMRWLTNSTALKLGWELAIVFDDSFGTFDRVPTLLFKIGMY